MKKRFLVVLLSAVMLISVLGVAALAQEPASVYEQSCYQHGDINNDGKIDSQDAVYTLFHAIPMFQEQYPIDQDCDFNKDTVVNSKDAIHLLYAADPEHASEYPLDGVVHRYFDPVWEWEADAENATAKATLSCGCGDKIEVTDIAITTGHLEEADCVNSGSKEYVGRFTCDGQIYVGTYTVDLPAGNGHEFDDAANCEEAVKCAFCDAERPAKGHTWVLNTEKSAEATCYQAGKQVWECACGASNEVDLGTVDHQFVAQEPVLAQGATCEYVVYHKCSVAECGEQVEVSRFTKHEYKVTLTKEADCTNYGEKTYTCTLCNDSYTEQVAPNGVHKWDDGVTANGVITYTCTVSGCGATQTAVAVQNDEAVSKETLQNTDKVNLEGGASVSLDNATVNALSGDVKISVKEADLTGTTIDAEKLAQIGNNKVYDFKLSDATGDLSQFDGKITVSLPYVLQDGDDIESIDVWYIGADGQPERMNGTYSNGYVTFETNHFSYYTVTRLSPKERCERYGHSFVTSQSLATCTEDGYTMNVCQRCGHSEKSNPVPKSGHNYQNTQNCKPATCTEDGLSEQECQNCHNVISQVLPAIGHNMQKDAEMSSEATCTATGVDHYACANENCDFNYDVELARKAHQYESEEVVPAGCDSMGYERFGCKTCDKEVIRNEKAALGHDFAPAKDGWTWSKDYKTATLKMVCANDSAHEKILNASVTEKMENSVCLGGAVTYTATVSYNLTTYTNTVTATEEGLGHVPSNRWIIENDRHYRICVVCGENADVGSHTYGEKTVTKAPTCVDTGVAIQACTVCGHEKTSVIDATGVHNYEDGFCADCGVAETGCLHIPNVKTVYDLAQYGACGGEVVWMSCSCGKVMTQSDYNPYCDWNEPKFSEEVRPDGTVMSVGIQTCRICGLERKFSDYSVDDKEKCSATWYEIEELTMGGTQIYKIEFAYWEQEHPAHVEKGAVKLADYGLCGGTLYQRSCYCGEVYGSYQKDGEPGCNWVYNEATDSEICADCGATYTWEGKEQEDGCFWIITGARVYSRNGKVAYRDEYRQIYEHHNYILSDVELLGKTCENGLRVVQVCEDCGKEDEYITTEHAGINQQVIDLSGYNMCCDALVISSCPCPEAHKDFWLEGGSHQWSHDYWSEDRTSATCMTCGTKWVQENKVGEKDADCHAMVTEKHTWTDKSGNQFQAERTSETERHNFTVKATLKGRTCEDGVTATYICSDCGFKRVENYDDHRTVLRQSYNLADYGGCESIIEIETCACQNYAYWGWNEHNCEFYHVTGDEHSNTRKCHKCGIVLHEETEELGRIDSCHYKIREAYSFSKDGVELFKFGFTPIREQHRNVVELTLHEGATSCEGGYHVKATCMTCGEVTNEHDSMGGSHGAYPIKREVICQGQLCGDIDLVTYRCACGEYETTSVSWVNGRCQMEHRGFENGYEVYYCSKCGVTQKVRHFRELIDGETCRYRDTSNYVFVKDGKTIAACDTGEICWDHKYEHTFQLNGTTCADGYTATGVCVLCGDNYSWSSESGDQEYHDMMPVEYTDLASHGVCGGELVVYQCPCGEEKHVERHNSKCSFTSSHRYETDINGVEHTYVTRTCRKCGLVMEEHNYSAKGEGCTMEEHSVITYKMGETLNKTYDTVNTYERHEYAVYSVSLVEGAQSCEDGVYVQRRCVDCGYENSYVSEGHVQAIVASEDLSNYGSVCGGKLELMRCACGEQCGYEFSEDTLCDLHEQDTECWIEDALHDSQYTTEGYIGAWSEFYMYVCPVTNPQACNLKIRMARYWLKDGCEATEYEIWQLGYNEEDGTFQKELKIATGEQVGFHNYENDWTTENPDDSTSVDKDSYVCPDCGSSFTRTITHINGQLAREETKAINTLNNGEAKERTEVYVYDEIRGDYRLQTAYNETKLNADGTTYWYKCEYTYPYEDACLRQVSWSDSNGDCNTYEDQGHHTEWSYEEIKPSTCTQHGERLESWTCVLCGVVESQQLYTYDPIAHNWYWSDDRQTYVCHVCDLESANGSSGDIVLEDLTDTYGAGTNYVIGFWNRGGVTINPYVSVILENVAEGENDELVLDAISFKELSAINDGVRALSFNKADIQAKAAEAIANAGYTGAYAIRISFVPVGSADTLDYAITFDSQMAE